MRTIREWISIIPVLTALSGCVGEDQVAPLDPSTPDGPGPVAAPPAYAPIDLGVPPGGLTSLAWGINDQSDVVGIADVGGLAQAFLKPIGAPMVVLPSLVAGTAAEAFDINNYQLSVGWTSVTTGRQAALWRGTLRPKLLGTLGGPSSYARAINDQHQVVGTSTTVSGQTHAFYWDGSGMVDLGTLGGTYAQANGINEVGVVTGCSSLAFGEIHPFLWDVVNGMQDIGVSGQSYCGNGINSSNQVIGDWFRSTTLAVLWAGGSWTPFWRRGTSYGAAINDAGSAVGTQQTGAGPLGYLWSPTGGLSFLPLLPSDLSSQAMAINRCGVVAGVTTKPIVGWRATLWSAGSGCTGR